MTRKINKFQWLLKTSYWCEIKCCWQLSSIYSQFCSQKKIPTHSTAARRFIKLICKTHHLRWRIACCYIHKYLKLTNLKFTVRAIVLALKGQVSFCQNSWQTIGDRPIFCHESWPNICRFRAMKRIGSMSQGCDVPADAEDIEDDADFQPPTVADSSLRAMRRNYIRFLNEAYRAEHRDDLVRSVGRRRASTHYMSPSTHQRLVNSTSTGLPPITQPFGEDWITNLQLLTSTNRFP